MQSFGSHHRIVNNSVILLFLLEFFPRYGVDPAVLIRLGYRILNTEFPQDLTLIRRMINAVDHTGIQLDLLANNILFTALARDPICQGVSV